MIRSVRANLVEVSLYCGDPCIELLIRGLLSSMGMVYNQRREKVVGVLKLAVVGMRCWVFENRD